MKYPDVRIGDVVILTTGHNETQDDIHCGIVVKKHANFADNGKADIFYLQNRWIPSTYEFGYSANINDYGWRQSDETIAVNAHRKSFTHGS